MIFMLLCRQALGTEFISGTRKVIKKEWRRKPTFSVQKPSNHSFLNVWMGWIITFRKSIRWFRLSRESRKFLSRLNFQKLNDMKKTSIMTDCIDTLNPLLTTCEFDQKTREICYHVRFNFTCGWMFSKTTISVQAKTTIPYQKTSHPKSRRFVSAPPGDR